MESIDYQYIYQPSILLEIILFLIVICSFSKPQYLTALSAGILLLRPNERFDCHIPYPKIILLILIFVIVSNFIKVKDALKFKDVKMLLLYVTFIFAQTLVLHREDLLNNLIFISTGLLLYLAIVIFIIDENSANLLNKVIAFSCMLICLEAVYYHFTEPKGSLLWSRFHHEDRLQAWGMWANSNETAFIACLSTASLLLLAISNRKSTINNIYILIVPFLLLVVLLTGSRAGLATSFLLVLPMLILMKSKTKRFVIITIVAGTIFMAYSLRPNRTDTMASSEERYDLRYEGRQLFKDHPVMGVGFNKAREETGGQPLHNTYLQSFAETGSFGGVLFINYLVNVFKNIRTTYKKIKTMNKSTNDIALILGLFIGCIFYFYWGNQLLTILFFLVMSQIKVNLALTDH